MLDVCGHRSSYQYSLNVGSIQSAKPLVSSSFRSEQSLRVYTKGTKVLRGRPYSVETNMSHNNMTKLHKHLVPRERKTPAHHALLPHNLRIPWPTMPVSHPACHSQEQILIALADRLDAALRTVPAAMAAGDVIAATSKLLPDSFCVLLMTDSWGPVSCKCGNSCHCCASAPRRTVASFDEQADLKNDAKRPRQ